MATSYGAHLSRNAGASTLPSVFDVLALEELTIAVRTAVRYVLHFSAQAWPQRCSGLYLYSEELIFALDFFLQFHHMKKYNASFGEHFYGLARENKVKLFRTLLLLTAMPYIHSKLENLYKKWTEEEDDGIPSRHEYWRTLFLRFYPYFFMFTDGSFYIFSVLYVLGRSKYHSLALYLSGTCLENFDREKHLQKSTIPYSSYHWSLQPLILLKSFLSTTADHATHALMIGAYLLQFLEWWYQNNDVSPFKRGSTVPPPPNDQTGTECVSDGKHHPKGKCPICKDPVVNETVLATSGFSFCYTCIFKHLIENNSCPVTGYPSSVDALIKVYQ